MWVAASAAAIPENKTGSRHPHPLLFPVPVLAHAHLNHVTMSATLAGHGSNKACQGQSVQVFSAVVAASFE